MNSRTPILLIIVLASLLLLPACRQKVPENKPDINDVLVSVGDSSLRLADVVRQIPRGLTPADSSLMFNQIVETWVREQVLTDVAKKNIPDMDRIDRLVETYRNNLILNEYLSTMSNQAVSNVPEEKIKDYYEQHHQEMLLEQPIIKGAFLKVSDADPKLAELRKWMSQFSDKSIDNIETSGLRQASQYKYFKDEWHEWNAVAEKIPYRFFDADAFVRSTRDFETQEGGSVYLLHISEFVPSGAEMPYEFAKLKIEEIIHADDLAKYRENLINDIYARQIKEGNLRPGLYNPVSRQYNKPKK